MKKLGLVSTLILSVILLARCTNKSQENIETEIIDEENIVVEEQENIDEKSNENTKETIQKNPDAQWWTLLAFNGKEVDGNYEMGITENGEIFAKFCNNIGGTIRFDGEDTQGKISASLIQTEMACEGESMDLENAFKIDGAMYNTIANEDGGFTMIITTPNSDKFNRRMILE